MLQLILLLATIAAFADEGTGIDPHGGMFIDPNGGAAVQLDEEGPGIDPHGGGAMDPNG